MRHIDVPAANRAALPLKPVLRSVMPAGNVMRHVGRCLQLRSASALLRHGSADCGGLPRRGGFGPTRPGRGAVVRALRHGGAVQSGLQPGGVSRQSKRQRRVQAIAGRRRPAPRPPRAHARPGGAAHRPDGAGAKLDLAQADRPLAHEGGVRFRPDSPEYAILRDWIAAGAPGLAADEPHAIVARSYANRAAC